MVEASAGRAAVKASLLAKVDTLKTSFDTYPTVFEDASIKYLAKQTMGDDGNSCTMVKWECDIATMETFQPMIDDIFKMGPIMNNKMSYEELPDHDGSRIVHIKAKMPMIMSNRSIISALYKETKEDGSVCVFHSSQGNEAQTTARAAEIGSDEIANMVIAYW